MRYFSIATLGRFSAAFDPRNPIFLLRKACDMLDVVYPFSPAVSRFLIVFSPYVRSTQVSAVADFSGSRPTLPVDPAFVDSWGQKNGKMVEDPATWCFSTIFTNKHRHGLAGFYPIARTGFSSLEKIGEPWWVCYRS